MNNRNGLIAAGVIAALALIFAVIQSGNLSQSENKLSVAQSTATAQQAVMTDQWVKSEATFSGVNTQAAATANGAATAQAGALSDAAKAAATAQAKALGDAAKAASTTQAQLLAAASQAAATAQASAVADAKNVAATTQAKSVADAKNTAATQQAQMASTLQAGATAKAQAVASQQAQATATLGAVIAQAATDRVDMQLQYQVTDVAVATQLAALNNQLATAQAAATNVANPTAVPTIVPTGEATAEATTEASGVPADWKRYVGKGVAIQLPKTYMGTELGSDPAALGKILRALGPDFAPAATLLESNPEILSFIAVNQGTGDANPASSVIILSIPLPTTFPIDALLEATINQLPSGSKVLEKSVVQFEGHDAGRMIVETHVGTIVSTQLQYYIIANNTLYLVGFTGTIGHFDAQLPSFEQSMKTFEILAKPGI